MGINSIQFSAFFNEALQELAVENNLKFKTSSYHDVIIKKLEWQGENEIKGLKFICEVTFIDVIYYVEKFPIWPQLIIWCHNYIPMFPYLARGAVYQLPSIPLNQDKSHYREIIGNYIKRIHSGDTSFFLKVYQPEKEDPRRKTRRRST